MGAGDLGGTAGNDLRSLIPNRARGMRDVMCRFPEPELRVFAIGHRIRIGSATHTSWTGRGGLMKTVKRVRDPDETRDMRELILEVIPDAERWMDTPHSLLAYNKPRDLIGTDKEEPLRNLVRS